MLQFNKFLALIELVHGLLASQDLPLLKNKIERISMKVQNYNKGTFAKRFAYVKPYDKLNSNQYIVATKATAPWFNHNATTIRKMDLNRTSQYFI
jgi:hypothetical protein